MTKAAKNEAETKTTDSPAQQSPKATKKSSKKGFFVYLTFMLLLAAGSAVATYYATPIVLASLKPTKPIVIKTIPAAKAQEIVVSTSSDTLFEQNEQNDLDLAIAEEETESVIKLPEEPAPSLTPVPPPSTQNIVIAQQQPQIQPVSFTHPQRKAPTYSVLKAMELRDAFKNGGECRPLLEELVALPNKTPDMDQALMELLQACLERPINGQMQQAFHSAKKRAILRVFQNNYPTYLAYLKSIPYFIANIRKKNPTGEDPLDMLDRIQNAVETDRPQLVLKLIPQLPDNVQATLHDVTQYAQAESNLYKTLNQLMKALFDGEER